MRGRQSIRGSLALVLAVSLVASACTNDDETGERDVEVRQPLGCDVAGCVGASVETSTGALVVDETDLSFPSGLFGVEIERSYRSDREQVGWFGRGWATVYETTLTVNDQGGIVIDAPVGLGPIWAPEAPVAWAVAGTPSITEQDDTASLRWPTGEMWSFDREGRLAALSSPYGATVAIVRDPSSGDVRIISSQGLALDLSMSSTGQVTQIAASDRRSNAYEYDGDQLISAKAASGESSYRYNSDGRMVARTTPAGTVTSIYDGGRVSEQTLPGGDRVDIEYLDNSASRVTLDGRTGEYQHDADGRLVSRLDDGGQVLARAYEDDRLVDETSFGGEGDVASRLERAYDEGRLVSETVDGVRRQFSYDGAGRVTSVETADGEISMIYSATAPLPVTVSSPHDGRQDLSYDDRGFVLRAVDASSVQTVIERDELGNATSVAQGERRPWTFRFDAEGNPTETTSPGGRTWTSTWLPGRRLAELRDPLGRVWSRQYDVAGREIASSTPGGATTLTEYDAQGRVTRRTEPDAQSSRIEYGRDGAITKVVRPGDRTWTYTRRWSGSHEIETANAPDGTQVITTRDASGRIGEVTYVNADRSTVQVRTFRYEFGRLVETTTREGASEHVTATTYDDAGRITEIAESLQGESTRKRTFEYSGGRLTQVVDADGTVTEYAYDAAGRLVSISGENIDQEAVYRQGLLAEVRDGDRSERVRYDEDARVVGIDRADDVAVTWGLDDAGRPVERAIGDIRASFRWSPNDRLIGYTDAAENDWTYGYDAVGRLLRVDEPSGQVTEYEYTLGDVTRIRSEGGEEDRNDTFEYDAATGQLSKADVRDDTTELTYDAVGRVATIDGAGDEETWRYDAAGRVVEAIVDDDRYEIAYNTQDRMLAVVGPDDESLSAVYEDDRLAQVVTSERDDPIAFERDELERLSSVSWDEDHVVELDWSDDGTALRLAQRDDDASATYRLAGDRVVGFEDDERTIDAELARNGSFSALTMHDLDDSATRTVEFDPSGRPEHLVAGERRALLGYDELGRINTVDTTDADEEQRTTVTYDEDSRDIDGDDDLVEAMYAETGSLRAALPGFLPNPVRPADPLAEMISNGGLDELPVIETPEPDPLAEVEEAVRLASPFVPAPIGVGELDGLAERLSAAALHAEAPVFLLNGDQRVRLPVLDPESGDVVLYNPFVDGSVSGLALGGLDILADSGRSLLDRSVDAIKTTVGGLIDAVGAVGQFLLDNPIGSMIPDLVNIVGCVVAPGLCVPLTVIAQLFTIDLVVEAGIEFVAVGMTSCLRLDAAMCGLAVGSVGVAALAGTQFVRLGSRLTNVAQASRQLRRATTATERSIASGRLGVRRSELLATVRVERIVASERPLCFDTVCARIDLVTRPPLGRLRLIEVKNGPGARLSANQRAVYPAIRTGEAYFPYGLQAGGSRETVERARYVQQNWAR